MTAPPADEVGLDILVREIRYAAAVYTGQRYDRLIAAAALLAATARERDSVVAAFDSLVAKLGDSESALAATAKRAEMWEIENDSRAALIQRIWAIIGYDNADGFWHLRDGRDPEQMIRDLVSALRLAREALTKLCDAVDTYSVETLPRLITPALAEACSAARAAIGEKQTKRYEGSESLHQTNQQTEGTRNAD